MFANQFRRLYKALFSTKNTELISNNKEKYNLLDLQHDDEDLQLIRDAFNASEGVKGTTTESVSFLGAKKIVPNNQDDPTKEKETFMLFHGTDDQNVEQILKDGFKVGEDPINGRKFGDGIYLSACSGFAAKFSNRMRDMIPSSMFYKKGVMLVCKVKGSEDFHESVPTKENSKDSETKTLVNYAGKYGVDENNVGVDSRGNKINKGGFVQRKLDRTFYHGEYDEYVVKDPSLVVPAYLVEFVTYL